MSELQQRLAGSADLIALQLQGREAARVQRDTVVPAGWIALVKWADGQASVVPAGAGLGSQEAESLALFRAGPIALSTRVYPVRTADGHETACSITLRFAVRPDVNELNVLLREFLKRSKSRIDLADVETYLSEHVLVAARVFARQRPSAELVLPAVAGPLTDYLVENLQRPLASVGLALVPGMLARYVVLGEAAIQFFQAPGPAGGQEILHRALLTQFEELAASATRCGERRVAEALLKLREKVAGHTAFTAFEQVAQVLPERIRLELYEALIKLFAAWPAERLAAVAGSQVACWRLADPAIALWKVNLPSDMGTGRSVELCVGPQGEPLALVGCQRGVAVLDAETGRAVQNLVEPYVGSAGGSGGFNAAVLRGRQVWASKSDSGLLCWDLDRPGAPWWVLGAGKGQPARFIRAVTLDPSAVLWFGADNWLVCSAGGSPTVPDVRWFVPIDAAVTSLAADGVDLWIGTQSGGLWRISPDDPCGAEQQMICRGQALEAITVRWTGPVRWLVYADGRGAVIRSVNGMYTRTLTGPGGVRACRIGGPHVVGLSDWRDSLLLWNCASSGRAPVELNVQRLTNARVQDFDVG